YVIEIDNNLLKSNFDKVYNNYFSFGIAHNDFLSKCNTLNSIIHIFISDNIIYNVDDKNVFECDVDLDYSNLLNYIKSTIKYDRTYNGWLVYNNIQFLYMYYYMYQKNVWMYYDDGMNYDSYQIGDALVKNMILMNDLDFNGYTLKIDNLIYLYGTLDGNGHTISNLKLKNGYMFDTNYGVLCNITFENITILDGKTFTVFKYDGYGEEINVNK
ncbi:MAG TPA: hypothetical protein O0X14_03105, partial [Methanocorpusculum sp.]|nr:hypothetical protein [Methanocorpusculum sp.]